MKSFPSFILSLTSGAVSFVVESKVYLLVKRTRWVKSSIIEH